MCVFGSYQYAGTWSPDTGCQVWRSSDGSTWDPVVGQDPPGTPGTGPGFGDESNMAAGCMSVFGSYLYVGTWNFDTGCQVWRSPDGTTWNQVVGQDPPVAPDPGPGFGDDNNLGAFSMSVFGSFLYTGTLNGNGCQAWRSADGITWSQVTTDGFGDWNNLGVSSMSVFGSYLYAGTWNRGTGCQVWKSADGITWNPTNIAGYGDVNNQNIYSMYVFGSFLYVGTTGCEVWRSPDGTSWHQVNEDGFGYESNLDVASMSVFGSCLYVGTFNPETEDPSTGCQVWKSYDGTTWKPVNIDGFGDVHNWSATSMSVFGSHLYVGTTNGYTGCQVWRTIGTNVVNASVSGGHGSVAPLMQEVEPGSPASVTVTPDAGYHTASVTDNGTVVSPTPTTLYTINNVTTNHDVVVTFASNKEEGAIWYLAEGTNAWGFSTYITIENPNNSSVTAKLTYMDPNPASGTGVVGTREVTLPPLSQTTISSMPDIGAVDFSTRVDCLQGKTIAVDRTMFWTGPGAPSQEGHSSIGTTTPATTWYLPEGSSAWGFETWTLIQNPGATDAKVRLTYMLEGGTPQVFDRTVPAHCRATYNMASDIGSHDASLKVTSDVPVVAERSMYRNNRREGSCSIGATTPAADYFLAEGATGYDVGFTTYVLVQNPNDSDVEVTLTYQTPSGPKAQAPFTMGANSRKTIKVNDQLPANTNVSTQVHGSQPIIAERAMYWGAGTPLGEAMHASIGLDSPRMSFYLPDGQTSDGHETWTLVQNPNAASVTVRITYLPQGGGTLVSFTDEIGANTRSTYSMADKGISGRASIMVQSLDGARPVMVERSMYWNNRGAGTNTVGGFSD